MVGMMSSVKSVPDIDVLEVEATISSLASGYDTIQRAIESVILLPTMVMVKSATFEIIVALDYDVYLNLLYLRIRSMTTTTPTNTPSSLLKRQFAYEHCSESFG